MESESRNIYKTARRIAGMTQERWAEAIGVCAESVRNYEAGRQIPADEVVITMIECSSYHVLGYQHLLERSRVAYRLLPQVAQLPLPQAVVQLLCAIHDFADKHQAMLRIAADGEVSLDEADEWRRIAAAMDEIIQAALQVKYAQGVAT